MGGLADIGINLPLLVAFIVSFVILFALLRLVLYKPVTKMLFGDSKDAIEKVVAALKT
jgi:hypothetical protein